MTMINPINELITDIAAKWDRTSIEAADATITTDIQIVSQETWANSDVVTSAGVIILERYVYTPLQKYGDHRDTRYTVDAVLIMDNGKLEAAWEATWKELDRVFNDYNDDTTTVRDYQIFDLTSQDNNEYYLLTFSIQVDVKAELLPT